MPRRAVVPWIPWMLGACLALCYLGATLPFLADYPIVDSAQMGIVAPAHKLATRGVYGNDLYRGFYRTDQLNYEYLPLYPLTVAAAFYLFDTSVRAARMVSVLCGALVLVLTWRLGRRLYDDRVGLAAAAFLVLGAIAVPKPQGGELFPGAIPLLDFARVIRYDVMVPIWVLAACLCFLSARERSSRARFFLTGALAGCATLTHLYGAFILVLLALVLAWQRGPRLLREPALYLMAAGWLLALVPWLLYLARDWQAFQGQALRHQGRFDLLSLGFFLDNLRREPWRYVKLLGTFREPILFPRVGLWCLAASLVTANVHLLRRARRAGRLRDRFLLSSVPLLALTLGALVSFKRYPYIVLLLPFLALQFGLAVTIWWDAAARRGALRAALGIVLLAMASEGGAGIARSLRAAARTTPYIDLLASARAVVPVGARVLMLHSYWLGLPDRDSYALDLAFVLTRSDHGRGEPPSVATVVAEIAPEYVVVKRELLRRHARDPASLPNAWVARTWSELEAAIRLHCLPIDRTPRDPDYEVVLVFRCSDWRAVDDGGPAPASDPGVP